MKAVLLLALIVILNPGTFSRAAIGQEGRDKAARSPKRTWSEAVAEIERENDRFRKTTNISLDMLHKEQQQLGRLKRNLAVKTARQEKELEKLRQTYNKMLQREESLIAEIAKENEELKTLEGTVRAAAKEADRLIRENPTSFETKGRNALVSKLLTPDHYPTLAEIRELTDLFFEEADLSSRMLIRKGEYIGAGGGVERGEIIRVGTFTTYFRSEGAADSGSGFLQTLGSRLSRFWNPESSDKSLNLGFLRPDTTSGYLVAVPHRPPPQAEEGVQAWLSGESDTIPVDISRGAIFRLLTTEKGLKDTLAKGGIIAVLILVIGILAVLIGFERLYVLVRAKTASERDFTSVLELVSEDRIDDCRTFCLEKGRAPTFSVLKRILEFAGSTREVLENAVEEAVMKEMPRLERFLPTLGILYAVAPLLGLLGTVTGMINTFQVISAFGTGDPKMMSGGISEALITTQLGLAVAVPIMLFHHYLERKVDRVMADMEEKGASLTVVLLKKNADESEQTDVDHAA